MPEFLQHFLASLAGLAAVYDSYGVYGDAYRASALGPTQNEGVLG